MFCFFVCVCMPSLLSFWKSSFNTTSKTQAQFQFLSQPSVFSPWSSKLFFQTFLLSNYVRGWSHLEMGRHLNAVWSLGGGNTPNVRKNRMRHPDNTTETLLTGVMRFIRFSNATENSLYALTTTNEGLVSPLCRRVEIVWRTFGIIRGNKYSP